MQDSSKRLEALAQYGILDTPAEPEFDHIVQIAQSVCQTPVALVSLVASDRQWFKARVGFDACETPLGQSVCAYALTSDDLFVIPDLTQDARTADNSLVTGEPFIRFYAGAPLKTPNGVAIGSLCVIDVKPRPQGLTADQATTLRALARQTIIVMELRKAMAVREAALDNEQRAHEASLERALRSEAASERLRDAEAMMRGAQEAARIGAFEVDIATNRFFVSAAFCRIFGLPELESYPGTELEDLILLSDRGRVASSRQTRIDATAPHDVEYRIRRAGDGAMRWIARRSAFDFDDVGAPIRMLGVIQDITDRKLAEIRNRALIDLGDELRGARTTIAAGVAAGRLLGETLAASRAGYGLIDEGQDTYTIESDWAMPGIDSIAGTWPNEAFRQTIDLLREGGPFVVANIPSAVWLAKDAAAYARTKIAAQINIPLVQDGVLVGVLFVHNHVPRTWSPAEIDFAEAVADRTYAAIAKIRAEAQQHVLNEELSHRLKNTLSMVQAIATQTLRNVTDRSVVKALDDRIIALSKAHDVLLQQNWTAASVAKAVAGVLQMHGRVDQFDIAGPEIMMGPKATLSLSLLLHELTTNSIKYGALSAQYGRIGFTWRIERDGPEPVFVLDWIEKGGPPAKAPTRRGFGTRLIGMGLAGAGHADLDYAEAGLNATFRAPLRSITSN